MTNEPLGIYEELRAKSKPFEERAAMRRRVLSVGPARNGAYAEPRNPFNTISASIGKGYYYPAFSHTRDHSGRRRAIYHEARLGLTIAQVLQAAALESGITHYEMFGQTRVQHITRPRQVAIWMIDRYCPEYSLGEIGYVFNRDHTTVMSSITKITELLKEKHPAVVGLVGKIHQRLSTLAESLHR